MNDHRYMWGPAIVLGVGVLLILSIHGQRSMDLRAPLETTVPTVIEGRAAQDIVIDEEEQRVAGMDEYVMRVYSAAAGTGAGLQSPGAEVSEAAAGVAPAAVAGAAVAAQTFSVYVGYYESQTQGKTIHSPKNCLPGAGWEALTSRREAIHTAAGVVPVNRYLLQKGNERALVLYWYQGRGRVAASEYAVKWHLLRDQALRRRSDEALVRVIVPVSGTEEEAMDLARGVARALVPSVGKALPA